MQPLLPEVAKQGYTPDVLVCPDDVGGGRPQPWMCFENMRRLGVYPSEAVVKIGDTPADIQEGLNAGMWTIGLAKTGNEVGLTLEEWQALAPDAQRHVLATAYDRLSQAGAHYIVDSLADIFPVLDTIAAQLAKGKNRKMRQADLLIVGAGVLGTFHALHALQRGYSVILLEKDAAPQDATVRNFGMVVPSGLPQGQWQQYGIESTRLYTSIQAQFDIGVRQQGSLYIASDQDDLGLLEELYEINQHNDYPSLLLSQDACLATYPALQRSYCVGGLDVS